MTWNSGYISEIDYIYGYFPELSPIRMKLALLSRRMAHNVSDEPTYLELGFGQGLSLSINAATSAGHYFGTDFNPAQAAHAMQLCAASGKPVAIFDQSFEDLAKRSDLPDFDIIALHGIWSWIGDTGRAAILDIVDRKLKPGGILYISYNVNPGWSPVLPLRHLLAEYARRAATGNIVSRVEQSIGFVEQVMSAGGGYFEAHPALRKRLDHIRTQDRSYVAHEYLNAFWRPESFAEVSDALAGVKLGFAASANLLDNLGGVSVPAHARATLESIQDPILRELTRDYFVNQQFRRDLFVKGPRLLLAGEALDQLRHQSFLLMGERGTVPLKVRSAAGEVDLRADIYEPIGALFADAPDRQLSLDEIRADPSCSAMTDEQVAEALLVLVGAAYLAPCSRSRTTAEDNEASIRLNREIAHRSQYSGRMQFLAAPRIGSAIAVGRIQQLLLLARASGAQDEEAFVWAVLERQGERLMVDGAPLASRDENIAQIKAIATEMKDILPLLERVGAILPEPSVFGAAA